MNGLSALQAETCQALTDTEGRVLLLHGLGTTARLWSPIADALRLEPQLRSINLPGHGGAPHTRDYSVIELADAVARGIGEATPSRTVCLMGVSLGGMIAQAIGARHPELVAGLILLDTIYVYPEPARKEWRTRARVATEQGMLPLLTPTLGTWFTERFRDSKAPSLRQFKEDFLNTDPAGYAAACTALSYVDLTALLAAIVAPTLILCGEHETSMFVTGSRHLQNRIENSKLVWIPGAKHGGVLEKATEVAVPVRTFLEEVLLLEARRASSP